MRARGCPAALAAAVVLLLAACSSTSLTPAPTLEPIVAGPTPTITTYPIDTTVWVQGFEVTVTKATASLDAKGGTLTVEASLANAGEDDATLEAPLVVTAGDVTFQLGHGVTLPDQPGGSVATVTLPFDVFGRSSVDDAVIRIGRVGDHVATIPLRPNGSTLQTLEPVEARLNASGRAGNLRAVLRHRQQRWDLPDWHDELPQASQALTLTYDVTYVGTFAGGTSFTTDNVRLRLPNGTLVAPRQDGHSQSIVLLRPGRTMRSLTSRFEIPDLLTGTFALVILDGSAKKSIPFTIRA